MVGICQCHIPTPIHYDIFPPGGNMTGGNLLGNHHNEHAPLRNDGDDDMMMMMIWVTQHIPTRHIPTRWEYDIMNRGGNVTLSYSHHIYIHHYIGMYG